MEDTLNERPDPVSPADARELYPNRAEIDLNCLRANYRAMRRHAEGSPVMAVVKADAYGHGAIPVARVLDDEGVEFLAVAQLQEAVELRRSGIERPILVMGVPRPEDLPLYSSHAVDLLVASPEWARAVAGHAGGSRPVNVHLKVDTGMHRLGMSPDDVDEAMAILEGAAGVRLVGLWTHLASADEPESPFSRQQFAIIEPVLRRFGERFEYVHLGASNAVHLFPDVALAGPRPVIRIGISLYGYLRDHGDALDVGLKPVMRVTSRVAQIRTIEAGESVSYNRRWTATERSRIATVSCGYADGYFRTLSNKASVGIRGNRYPVVGTICMDLIMVDLGPPGMSYVEEGDEVVLFGDGGPTAYEVAAWADTIVYEVCTNVSRRVLRVYHDPPI